MKRPHTGRRRRSESGVSLTELLVGSILLGISLAVVAELMSLCVMANTKLFRQFDAQNGVNFALERIKRDVRMAQEVRVQLSKDELELLGQPRILASNILILRLPIQYLAKVNDPTSSSFDSGAAQDKLNGFTIPGYYLMLYEVVPDPDVTGEYRLVVSSRRMPKEDIYSGKYSWFVERSSFKSDVTAQVIAKGIVGPIGVGEAQGARPKVFSYVARNPNEGNRLDVLQESQLFEQSGVADGIAGVGIDLEVRRGEDNSENTANEKIVAVHTEASLRITGSKRGPMGLNYYE